MVRILFFKFTIGVNVMLIIELIIAAGLFLIIAHFLGIK